MNPKYLIRFDDFLSYELKALRRIYLILIRCSITLTYKSGLRYTKMSETAIH